MNEKNADFRARVCCLFLLLAVVALGAGCGGIQASKSISPLDFLIPGIGMTGSPDEGLTQTGSGEATPHAVPLEPSTS